MRMEEVEKNIVFISEKVVNVDPSAQRDGNVCCKGNDIASPFNTKINEISSAENLDENSAEYHSTSQPSAMDSSSTEIKFENISDIKENEEYLFETNNVFDEHSYAKQIKTEREEDIVNMLPECIDASVISDLDETTTESGIHPLHNGMTCKIEEAQILFGMESALEKAHISSEFANGKYRSDRKLSNWLDGTETFTFKEELTEAKDTSPKCPDRQKTESFIVQYSLDCDISPYNCPDCDKRFKYKQSLQRHQMSRHSQLKPYKCPDCGKRFAQKATLRYHQMSQHSKLRPHKCPVCEKSFVTKSQRDRHQRLQHSRDKAHKCPDCDSRFVSKHNLECHQVSRHSKSKPNKCRECGQSFARKHMLGHHEMVKHSKPQPYRCPDCTQSFVTKYWLDKHQMSQHLKRKPHKCPDCERTFASTSHLKDHHMFQHSKVKAHECSVCDKNFVRKQELRRHQMSQHSEFKSDTYPDSEDRFSRKSHLHEHQIN